MAYAYPNSGDAAGGSHTSLGIHSSPVKSTLSRKGSEERFDVLHEFKVKIEEDENYISFFQDRIRVEEEYIAGLKRIYARSKAVDTLHDDAFKRDERPTTRTAWDEVRDYTTREVQAREAMVGALKEVVVKELVRLKEEQTRIRMGLKENMKHANEKYDDHARNQLPKLKRTYWQKCQVLEDHRRQEHAIAMQAKLLADSQTSPTSTPLREHPNTATWMGAGASPLSPPSSTPALPPASNPQMISHFDPTTPASKHDKRSSVSHGRLRAGSAGGQTQAQAKDVLNDIAAQGKKGFNAIMQKFGGDKSDREEGGFVVVSRTQDDGEAGGLQRKTTSARGDPSRGMGTMKGVKVKREADDADKAYRLGVFNLESLRLRRDKLQTSAARNLETFNDDLNKTLITALEVYIDTLHGTAATTAQATQVVREAIEAVNLDRDTSLFRTRLRAVDTQRTPAIPYHNFFVGECRSLIFGVSLTDYDFARGEGSDHGRPPTIVEKCIVAIDEKGLDAEGIYRISGRHAGVQKGIELDEEKFIFDEKDDVFSISNVLKQYLRELPEPVFHFPHADRVRYTENRETHIHSNFSTLRGRLRRLAPIHQTTFQAIIEHLSRVAANSTVNKMDAKNLAVVFNSVLFGQDHIGSDVNLLIMTADKDTLLEDIITYSDLLFGAEDMPHASALLPPGVALSRAGVISFHPVDDGPQPGSSRTRYKVVDPTEHPTTLVPGGTSASATPPEGAVERSIGDLQGQQPVGMEEPDSAIAAADVNSAPSSPGRSAFTPDEELDLLFDPSFIPKNLRDSLGSDLHVRPLASTDFMRSHFGLLQVLTDSPPMAPSVYSSMFAHLKSCPETYFILAIIDKKTDQMVAHGAAVVEKKYIHGGASAAHIEDIVVSPTCQGGGVGKKLVIGLRDLSAARGCYRVELHCSADKIPFYEKCGFKAKSHGMTYYTPKEDLVTSSTTLSPSHTVPPPSSGTFGNMLSIHTGPALTFDLASTTSGGEPEGGSPTTVTSSGSGVTYSFPVPPAVSSAQAPQSVSSPSISAPPLPPRPMDRRDSDTMTNTAVPPPTGAPPLPARPDTHRRTSHCDSPSALGEAEDAPALPTWASEGLGDSQKLVPVSTNVEQPKVTSMLGLGVADSSGTERESTVSPLPPGAAPPHWEGGEPERVPPPRE